MRTARVSRLLILASLLLLGTAPAAPAQFVSPYYHTATPTVLPAADPPPAGSAKPGDMGKLYDKCLTCDRPVKYGNLCCKQHKGCFQKETIFDWSIGCDPMKKNGNGDDKNGNGNEDEASEPEEEDRLTSDRPDFTEASSTVGRGRIQLESGYTYIGDRSRGVRTRTHSYPEVLLRIGMFADWFELRIAQNVLSQSSRGGRLPGPLPGPGFPAEPAGVPAGAARVTDIGASDLYLGAKLALTKQKGVLPETALIIQGTVPTGARAFTADRVLYGFNYLFSWELNDTFSLAGSFQGNKAVDDTGRDHVFFSQSLSIGYALGKNLTGYTEWFALYPTFANDTGGGAQHYLDGGFQYFVTKDFALDIRAGIGLSRSADDVFAGAGFVVRY